MWLPLYIKWGKKSAQDHTERAEAETIDMQYARYQNPTKPTNNQ